MLKEDIKITSYEEYKNKITTIAEEAEAKKEKLFVLFTGNKDSQGNSWCPDCVDFEVLFDDLKKTQGDKIEGCLVRVFVGDRDEWKAKTCPYRLDPQLKLSSIPTITQYGSPKKIFGDFILNPDVIMEMFEEED